MMQKFTARHRAALLLRSHQHDDQALSFFTRKPSDHLCAGRLPQPNQRLALDDSAKPVQIAKPHDCRPTFEDAVS